MVELKNAGFSTKICVWAFIPVLWSTISDFYKCSDVFVVQIPIYVSLYFTNRVPVDNGMCESHEYTILEIPYE